MMRIGRCFPMDKGLHLNTENQQSKRTVLESRTHARHTQTPGYPDSDFLERLQRTVSHYPLNSNRQKNATTLQRRHDQTLSDSVQFSSSTRFCNKAIKARSGFAKNHGVLTGHNESQIKQIMLENHSKTMLCYQGHIQEISRKNQDFSARKKTRFMPYAKQARYVLLKSNSGESSKKEIHNSFSTNESDRNKYCRHSKDIQHLKTYQLMRRQRVTRRHIDYAKSEGYGSARDERKLHPDTVNCNCLTCPGEVMPHKQSPSIRTSGTCNDKELHTGFSRRKHSKLTGDQNIERRIKHTIDSRSMSLTENLSNDQKQTLFERSMYSSSSGYRFMNNSNKKCYDRFHDAKIEYSTGTRNDRHYRQVVCKELTCIPVRRVNKELTCIPVRRVNKELTCIPVRRVNKELTCIPVRRVNKELTCIPVRRVNKELTCIPVRRVNKELTCIPVRRVNKELTCIPVRRVNKELTSIPVRRVNKELTCIPVRRDNKELTCIPVRRVNESIIHKTEKIFLDNVNDDLITLDSYERANSVEKENIVNVHGNKSEPMICKLSICKDLSKPNLQMDKELIEEIDNNATDENGVAKASSSSVSKQKTGEINLANLNSKTLAITGNVLSVDESASSQQTFQNTNKCWSSSSEELPSRSWRSERTVDKATDYNTMEGRWKRESRKRGMPSLNDSRAGETIRFPKKRVLLPIPHRACQNGVVSTSLTFALLPTPQFPNTPALLPSPSKY